MELKKEITIRKFNGKIDNFADKLERRFQKAHLHAYLKGWELFRFGFNSEGKPNWYFVDQTLKTIKTK